MTENVLSNIFESLSLGDKAAAETQLDEWLNKASTDSHQDGDEYDIEDDGRDTDSDEDKRYNVRRRRGQKVVGMGLDSEAAGRYSKNRGGLPPIGAMEEDAGDRAAPRNSAPWSRAIRTFIDNQTSAIAHAEDQEQVDDSTDAIETAKEALVRFNGGFPDQGLAKLRELDTWHYEQVIEILPDEYRDYATSMKNGGITTVRETDAVNTTRQCAACHEVDAAMAEDAEFCDQCIQEANAAHPDLVRNDEPDVMIPVKDIKWSPSNEAIDPVLAGLMEEFKGFTVVDKLANKEGAQVGNADAIQVNDKSPVPNIKASKRVGGSPVEIKAEEHKGFDAEKAPEVKDVKVKNLAPQPKPGEFSDKLDNVEGAQVGNADKVKINTISPIGSKSRD